MSFLNPKTLVQILVGILERNASHSTAMARKLPRKPKRPRTMLATPVSQYFQLESI